MNAIHSPDLDSNEWRRTALDRLGPEGKPGPGWGESMRLVYELRVHQLELELQNENLKEARLEAESGWAHYRELYDFAPVGYFTLDPDGLILQTNLAGAKLLHLERSRVMGRRFEEFLDFSDRSIFCAFLEQGLATEDHQVCEVALAGARWIHARLESTSSHRGELRVMAVDITELLAVEAQVRLLNGNLEKRVAKRTAQLEAANAEMQSFCYMISHELRAPLARMDGFSRMILGLLPAQGADRLTHVAQRIMASSLVMRQVIDSLLKMTRLSLEEVEPGPVDLSTLVRETLETLSSEGRAMPEQQVVAEGLTVTGDGRLLGIALRNLLENAVKFSSRTPGSRVEFGVLRGLWQVGSGTFYIRDNGAGFDATCADKLFQPFVRMHRQDQFEGTGIGLCLVRRIVEKHGGRVWAESQPDAGATFFFTLG